MKILKLIKTSGLIYDDRLRKEARSLQRMGCDVRVVALEERNEEHDLVIWEGIAARTLRLHTRGWFKQGAGLLFKTAEMYVRFTWHLLKDRPQVAWLHDPALGGLIPLLALLRSVGVIDRIVWDQHELPPDGVMRSAIGRWTLALIMNLCDETIVASPERREYLAEKLGRMLRTEMRVVENLPDVTYVELPPRSLPVTVNAWLDGSPFVVAQGGANPSRNLENLALAIRQLGQVKLLVVGPHAADAMQQLQRKCGHEFADWVMFTGSIPQLELTPFVDHAVASVVFYSRINTNSLLCAPNRLFQAVSRGVPVVVGINPPMAAFVDRYGCGVVVEDSPESIATGIQDVLTNLSAYREKARAAAGDLLWETQEGALSAASGQ